MLFSRLRQLIANWLDILQRYLIKDQFSSLSRTQLIERLMELENRYQGSIEYFNPQIIHLLEDLEAMYFGDLSVRTNTTDDEKRLNVLKFGVTGAHHDVLNLFLEDLCELIVELPEESPLRKKYRLPEKFYKQ